MLHIAGDELPPRSAQQMFARHIRSRHTKRHHILKLVAKTISTARLIEGRTRPHSTRERLIEQPTVQQNIHGAVRCPHLHRAECVVPQTRDGAEDGVEIGSAVFFQQRSHFSWRRCLAEQENDVGRAIRLELEPGLKRAAGIEAGADPIGKRCRAGEGDRLIERTVTAEELRSVAGP
jgi:hypothetical protein